MEKQIWVGTRVPAETHKTLDEAAKVNGRSMTKQIAWILGQYVIEWEAKKA